LEIKKNFFLPNEKINDSALVALIIDEDKIDVRGIATCGWKAIGTTKTVTKSESNIVYTIDDKPALDMLMNYLGVEIKQEGNKEIVTFLSSWYYPLQVDRENADPVIRTAMFHLFVPEMCLKGQKSNLRCHRILIPSIQSLQNVR
jgi:hypothetical protein